MIGSILLLLGALFYLIGAIGVLVEEFRESIIWGLFGLFTQVANILFAILYFKRCKRWLGLMLIGLLLIVLGTILFTSMFEAL